jgi:hypothetical protein
MTRFTNIYRLAAAWPLSCDSLHIMWRPESHSGACDEASARKQYSWWWHGTIARTLVARVDFLLFPYRGNEHGRRGGNRAAHFFSRLIRKNPGQPMGRNRVPYPVIRLAWWSTFVRKLWRAALLSTVAMLCVQPATFFVPSASAAAVPAAASKAKKKTKHKSKKQKILKGHHGKHAGKPA